MKNETSEKKSSSSVRDKSGKFKKKSDPVLTEVPIYSDPVNEDQSVRIDNYFSDTNQAEVRKESKELVRHTFSEDEILQRGKEIAENHLRFTSLQAELKSISADYKAKIESIKAVIESLSSSINQGYEMRKKEVLIRYNVPKRGMKTIIVKETGEVFQPVPMSADESQLQIEGL